VIAGEGLVLVPVGPNGELVKTDGEKIRFIDVGGVSLQVFGNEVTVNGKPLEAGEGEPIELAKDGAAESLDEEGATAELEDIKDDPGITITEGS
jgi:hypothetical protein